MLKKILLSKIGLWVYTQQNVRIGLETHHIGHYWLGMRFCSHISIK
jgi:hypothetical protein